MNDASFAARTRPTAAAALLLALATLCACGDTDGGAGNGALRDGGAPPDAGFSADGGAPRDGGSLGDGGGLPVDAGFFADGGVVSGDPVDPACTRNGCLREVIPLGDYTRAQLAAALQPGVGIDNGYSVYTIRFATDGRESTGTVTIPYDPPNHAPTGGFHVVGNQHGTTGIGDRCKVSGSVLGAGLAGTFGARGLIGVAVDYAGLGTPGVHPYLVSRVEGTSALDGLRAAMQLARLRGFRLSGRSALVGLSQGGHATLAAAALHRAYAGDLDLRAVGVVAPASVWPAQWEAGVGISGPHIAQHALLVYAWADYYRFSAAPLWTDALAPDIARILEDGCVGTLDGPQLSSTMPQDPALVFHPSFLAAYRSGSFGVYTFLARGFAENALGAYTQTAPLRIYQGDLDSVIAEPYTHALVDALRDGGVTVDYQVVSGGTHFDVAFGYVAFAERRTDESIAWVKRLLDQ